MLAHIKQHLSEDKAISISELDKWCRYLLQTNAELLECLEWYGDRETYRAGLVLVYRMSRIELDHGERAREMIAKVKGMQDGEH